MLVLKGLEGLHGGGDGLVTKSCPTLATPWTIAHQAPLSMGFSRQEYWCGLPFPSPGDLGNPLQYSCLENPMDRGAWQAIVHGAVRVGHDLATKLPSNTVPCAIQ